MSEYTVQYSEDHDSIVNTHEIRLNSLSVSTLQALQQHLNDLNNEKEIDISIDSNDNSKFKKQEYWDKRFENEDQYDWLCTFQDLNPYLKPLINFDDDILIVGCGNSSFSSDLYDAGYHNITNIDFSESVVRKMETDNLSIRPKMKWVVMDMTSLTFHKKSFDVVIDKASMDALVVDEVDVWDPNDETIAIVDKMCISVSEVLKSSSGKFIQVSFAQPHFRTKYLIGDRILSRDEGKELNPYEVCVGYSSRYDWNLLKHLTVDKDSGCLNCFVYIMIKQ